MTYGKRPPLDEQKALFEATVAAEGVTTLAGEGTGLSLIDAGLAGAGANSFVSMMAVIHPGDPQNVDSKDITAFDNDTGEVTVASAFKGGQVAAGVPYKIVTFRFVPAEVAAIAAALAAHEVAQLASRGEVTSIETKVDDLDADLIAHEVALATHDTALTAAKAVIDAIKLLLDTPADFMADVSAITEAGPTKAEMDAAHALLATLAKQDSHEASQVTHRTALTTHDTDIKGLLGTIAGYIDNEIAAIETKLDSPANFMADVSALALEATLTAIKGAGWTDENLKIIDGLIDNLITAVGAIEGATTLHNKLTAARAALLDQITALRMAELDAANLPTDVANVKAETALIKTQTDKIAAILQPPVDFWSDPQEEISVPAAAATLVFTPTVTIGDLPATATIVRAIAMFKFRMVENFYEGVNALDGATDPDTSQVIQVKEAAGAYTDAIKFVDTQFTLASLTREGGDVLIGSIDISGVGFVDDNGVYTFQWKMRKAAQDSINFNDCQVGLRIWYSI